MTYNSNENNNLIRGTYIWMESLKVLTFCPVLFEFRKTWKHIRREATYWTHFNLFIIQIRLSKVQLSGKNMKIMEFLNFMNLLIYEWDLIKENIYVKHTAQQLKCFHFLSIAARSTKLINKFHFTESLSISTRTISLLFVEIWYQLSWQPSTNNTNEMKIINKWQVNAHPF